jgi:2-polyprenyl-6-methoxyphenol hydroxylase-like FAD-dependent oxidoreductase
LIDEISPQSATADLSYSPSHHLMSLNDHTNITIFTDRSYQQIADFQITPVSKTYTHFQPAFIKNYGQAYGFIIYDPQQNNFKSQAQQWFDQGEVIALLPICFDLPNQYAKLQGYQVVLSTQNTYTSQAAILKRLHGLHDIGAYISNIHAYSLQNGIFSLDDLKNNSVIREGVLAKPHSARLSGFCLPNFINHQGNQSYIYLGEAAHQLHPLAGQGLNLGLRDVAELIQISDVLIDPHHSNNYSVLQALKRYQVKRQKDCQLFWHLTNTIYHSSQQTAVLRTIDLLLKNTGLLKSELIQKLLMKIAQ